MGVEVISPGLTLERWLWHAPPVSRFQEPAYCSSVSFNHFHVAGWIWNYWPTWHSRLASRAGSNDTKLEEVWCKRYSFRAICGQDMCTKRKPANKNTEKHLSSKKASPWNWSISYFLYKGNVVLEAHKWFQKTKLNNIVSLFFSAIGGGWHSEGSKKTWKNHTTGKNWLFALLMGVEVISPGPTLEWWHCHAPPVSRFQESAYCSSVIFMWLAGFGTIGPHGIV